MMSTVDSSFADKVTECSCGCRETIKVGVNSIGNSSFYFMLKFHVIGT